MFGNAILFQETMAAAHTRTHTFAPKVDTNVNDKHLST